MPATGLDLPRRRVLVPTAARGCAGLTGRGEPCGVRLDGPELTLSLPGAAGRWCCPTHARQGLMMLDEGARLGVRGRGGAALCRATLVPPSGIDPSARCRGSKHACGGPCGVTGRTARGCVLHAPGAWLLCETHLPQLRELLQRSPPQGDLVVSLRD